VYSPDIEDVTDEVIAHWLARTNETRHPVLRARYADLAWEIGTHKKLAVRITREVAIQAIDAYLESVSRKLYDDEHVAWVWIDRAAELATTTRDERRFRAARAAAFELARANLAAGKWPRLWRFEEFAWARRFVALEPDLRTELVDMLERALKERANASDPATFDPHSAMDIAERLRRWRAKENDVDAGRRAIAMAGEALEAAAARAGGLVATAWLEGLLAKYRDNGMRDAAARVEGAIRSRSADARAEMKQQSVELKIPGEELRKYADDVAGENPGQGLRRVAAAMLIRQDSTEKSIKETLSNAVLLAHIPMTLTGPGGMCEATIGSLDEDLEGRAIRHAAELMSSWHLPWSNAALARLKEKHALTVDHVMEVLSRCEFYPEERAPLLRHGVQAWLAEDFVTAIHVLVPQLEAAVRECLAKMGGSVWRPNHHGGFKVATLGDILNDRVFVPNFLRDLRFHLKALYADPRGLNIRNHMAHGLLHPSMCGRAIGNLVFHSVLMMAMLESGRATTPVDQTEGEGGGER
jgi:hypothetical protein